MCLIGKVCQEMWELVSQREEFLLNTIVIFREISATVSDFLVVLPACAEHKHPPVQQHVRTISPQSYSPVEHRLRFRTSHPDCPGHRDAVGPNHARQQRGAFGAYLPR